MSDHDARIPTSLLAQALRCLALLSCATLPAWGQYPAGLDDARLTEVQADGNISRSAQRAAVAYSESQNLYALAWIASDEAFALVVGEQEVFVRLFDADGVAVSSVYQASAVAPVGDTTRSPFTVDLAWGVGNTLLVVWDADDDGYGSADNQAEVYARRLSWTLGGGWSSDGTQKLSDAAGMAADPLRDAAEPAVEWGSGQQEWLIVWRSDTPNEGLSQGEAEIFGQPMSAVGAPVGDPVRLSAMGVPGDPQADAILPDLAYDAAGDRFLLVWTGDDVKLGWAEGHHEVFGRLVTADLALLGTTTQLSAVSDTADSAFDAEYPRVAFSPVSEVFFVVWHAVADIPPLDEDKSDVWGRPFADDATPLTGQLYLGQMGEPEDPMTGGVWPRIAWNPAGNQFLVVWYGADVNPTRMARGGPGPDLDVEVWGRSILYTGVRLLGPKIQISDQGGDEIQPELYDARLPAVTAGDDGRLLVVWQGDDAEGDLVDNEFEIYGELVRGHVVFSDDFESGDTDAWSL